MVVCLTLLVRSAGFARIEEANATQLTVERVDLRLLRCRGEPFGEQDLLAAHRASAFIATATGLAAAAAADGADIEITAFDSQWHWAKIAPQHANVPN